MWHTFVKFFSLDITDGFCFPSEPTGEKLLSSHVADILLEDLLPTLHSFLHSYSLCINMKDHQRRWRGLGKPFLLSRPFPWGTPSNELRGLGLALCRAGVEASALFPCFSTEISNDPGHNQTHLSGLTIWFQHRRGHNWERKGGEERDGIHAAARGAQKHC